MPPVKLNLPNNFRVERFDRLLERMADGTVRFTANYTVEYKKMVEEILKVPVECPVEKLNLLTLESAQCVGEEGDLAVLQVIWSGGLVENQLPKLKLIPSISEEPIETHPKFKNLTSDHLKFIADYLQKPGATVTVNDLPSEGLLLLSKKLRGQDSFLATSLTLRATYTKKGGFAGVKRMRIDGPPTGAPSVEGGANWLYVPGEQDSDTKTTEYSHEWRLSGPGGWDPDFYK